MFSKINNNNNVICKCISSISSLHLINDKKTIKEFSSKKYSSSLFMMICSNNNNNNFLLSQQEFNNNNNHNCWFRMGTITKTNLSSLSNEKNKNNLPKPIDEEVPKHVGSIFAMFMHDFRQSLPPGTSVSVMYASAAIAWRKLPPEKIARYRAEREASLTAYNQKMANFFASLNEGELEALKEIKKVNYSKCRK